MCASGSPMAADDGSSAPAASQEPRLGIYVDGPYALVESETGTRLVPDPADSPFLLFALEVSRHFESVALFARVEPRSVATEASPPLPNVVRVVRLPPYGSLPDVRAVARAAWPTSRAFWSGLAEVDIVWVFGPHPLGLLLVLLAGVRRKRIVLGVRQDTVAYAEARSSSGRRRLLVVGAHGLDLLYRLFARRCRATVVGAPNVRRYGGPRAGILDMTVSLVRARDVVSAPIHADPDGTIELLAVGRIDLEKNPLLLVDALGELERRSPGRYRLTWIGTGPLGDDVVRRAADLGLSNRVALPGYIPFGAALLERYRQADVFVHVSLTEGVPQVLIEAMGAGIPIVATDVGGVRSALGDGRAGLLVPPRDLGALVEAIARVSEDRTLRTTLVDHGLELAHELTFEHQAERVARFMCQ